MTAIAADDARSLERSKCVVIRVTQQVSRNSSSSQRPKNSDNKEAMRSVWGAFFICSCIPLPWVKLIPAKGHLSCNIYLMFIKLTRKTAFKSVLIQIKSIMTLKIDFQAGFDVKLCQKLLFWQFIRYCLCVIKLKWNSLFYAPFLKEKIDQVVNLLIFY